MLRGRDDVSKDWVLTVSPLVPDPVLLSIARYGLKGDCSAALTGTSTYADAKPASWKYMQIKLWESAACTVPGTV